MGKFIHIRSNKFPVLPGEDEEIVNDGMYGKALAEYLKTRLGERGWAVPFVCAEDWGWWVEVSDAPFGFGACIYSAPNNEGLTDFVCTDGATSPRKWSWKKFGFIDTIAWATKLTDDLVTVFESDPDVKIVEVSDDFPL